jgi:hypothetical protein
MVMTTLILCGGGQGFRIKVNFDETPKPLIQFMEKLYWDIFLNNIGNTMYSLLYFSWR